MVSILTCFPHLILAKFRRKETPEKEEIANDSEKGENGPQRPRNYVSEQQFAEAAAVIPGWLKRRIQNSKTGIGSLPDELLLMVMKDLKKAPIDLYMLRQASYLFARLFCDRTFFSLQSSALSSSRRGKLHRFNDFVVGEEKGESDEVFRRLFMVHLCTVCQQLRQSDKLTSNEALKVLEKPTFCKGCHQKHPSIMFSAHQRELSQASGSSPVCIVHEGYVRLCRHEHISRSQIEGWIQAHKGKDHNPELKETVLECSQCFTDMKPSGLPLSVFEDETYQPRVVVSGSPLLGAKLDMVKVWEVPMVRLTESTGKVATATEEMISTALEELQRNYGHLACPHVRFTDGRLLKAFSYDDCSCLYDMALMEKQQPVMFQATNHHHIHQDDCLCQQPWAERQRLLRNEWYGGDTGHWPLRDRKKREKQDADFQFAEHRVSCRFCDAQYKWTRRGNEFWLSFRQRLTIENLAPSHERLAARPGAYFMESIEPSSYGNDVDVTSKLLPCCTNHTCANYNRAPIRHSLLRIRIARMYSCQVDPKVKWKFPADSD